MEKEKFWKLKDSLPAFNGKWISMKRDQIEIPDGSMIEFEGVYYHFEGAGVVARNSENKIVLVKNYRYLTDFYSWEVPAGAIDKGTTPEETIIKELKEEAGCEVNREDLKYLGYCHPSIGSSNQKLHYFSAKNVKQISDDFDKNEIVDCKWFTQNEVCDMIRSGEIKDQFSVNMLLWEMFL
ncbi:MAG TPA: NUDIX hydrolase [Ignavibacteria bacterium]|nr:NUDIX hydrolase [Ignavibacteria bacterium]